MTESDDGLQEFPAFEPDDAAHEIPALETEPAAPRSRVWLLVLGALGIIAVPTLIGFAMINRDGGSGDSSDMGGMGGTPTDTPVASSDLLDLMTIVDDDGIRVEVHGDGTATIFVTTTIDVACAVSYGSTEALGAIATDSDMAGGGHSDHHPLLVNLVDNTDYFYKINAIGPEGEVYTTNLRSFTNGASTSAAPGVNLSGRATVVEVSSEFSANFSADLALDGDRTTEWSSAGDGDDAYIVIDMGAEVDIVGIGFRTREMSDGTSITTSFTVTVDGRGPLGPFDAGVGLAIAELETSGQIVRIDVATSTGGNTGAIEIEIYGSETGPPPPPPVPPVVPSGSGPPAPNIAIGATISDVSSEFSADYAAANAVDSNPATEWSSAGDGDDAYISINLGQEAEIAGVGFLTRSMTDGTSITTSFTVTVGTSEFGPFEAGQGLSIAEFEAKGRIVRIDVATSTGGNTGALEIEVYGSFAEEEM
jgi:hypothetical protein